MSTDSDSEFGERVAELVDRGVPERRAEVVARREQGWLFREIRDDLGLSSKGNVSEHLTEYENQYERAERLIADGPDPDDLY